MSKKKQHDLNGSAATVPTSLPDSIFPFKTQLSLRPLIDYLGHLASDNDGPRGQIARSLIDMIDEVPELKSADLDEATLKKHEGLITALLESILPWTLSDDIQLALTAPYALETIYATPEFKRLGLIDKLAEDWEQHSDLIEAGRALNAYHHILDECYGVGKGANFSTVVTVRDEKTGLDRGFSMSLDPHFCTIKGSGKNVSLSEEDIQELQEERMNLDVWKSKLPPEQFLFRGFMIIKAIDVTDQHMMTLLRDELLHRDALSSLEKLDRIQHRIRSLLGRPEIRLGILTRERGDDIGEPDGLRPVTRSLLLGTSDAIVEDEEIDSTYYKRVFDGGETIIVNDLSDVERSTYEENLHRKGVRNLYVAPLKSNNQVIGMIELGSPNPGDIHFINAMKLEEMISLFATILRRYSDEQENYIQAIIKEHYTAIHPAVEWRFRDAAKRWMKRRKAGLRVKPEHIVFNDIYSLYGLSDIRGSSTERNLAIQSDLLEQLQLAHSVISEATGTQSLPVLDEIGYRIVKAISEVEQDLHSGDDFRILEFMQQEVETLFPQLEKFGPEVSQKIAAYRTSLDPRLGVIYRERKDYEESVMMINDVISSYIERQEERAQQMFPHYFEKYKTDGVDYNIYVGAALQKSGQFDRLYLQNLRLWQLMMTCGLAYELEGIRADLKKPLDVAHLILVQDIPISIRFRIDEKQFDVDGAYNIRYEIVKKRIDKAEIRGTDERLTQPGKIAIVYSQDREANEYRRYIDYLQASGYIEPEIEELELEDLQGVHGLRALRVKIAVKNEKLNGNGIVEHAEAILHPLV